jgi:hypothetical protein
MANNSQSFSTEQEAFWGGDSSDAYADRNDGDAILRSNLMFWGGGLFKNRATQQLL